MNNKDDNKELIDVKKKKRNGIIKIIITIVITAIVTYFLTITLAINSFLQRSDITYFSTKIALIKKQLERVYIYDIKEDEMIENAIKGYVQGINDKYTQYLTKEEMESLMEDTSGAYVGIGIYMANNIENDSILIIGVVEDSAAQKAGIKAGDIIKKVNGTEVKGSELDRVSNEIKKGEEGTTVKLSILRAEEELDIEVMRSNIKLKTVASQMLDNDIGYIKIASFAEGTAEEFKEAYQNLNSNDLKGIVLDLRNNGGGLVSSSLEIAETMVEKDKPLLVTTDKKNKENIKKAKEDPIIKIPVVILINNNTASASEILAGILRDDCNFKIVGTTSYGKGVIQNVYNFSDGSGLKVTSEEYFTPNHGQINKVGIEPDIKVNLDAEWENMSNVPYDNDLQLQAAVKELKGV